MSSIYSQFLLKEKAVLFVNNLLRIFSPKIVLIKNVLQAEENYKFLLANGYKLFLNGKRNIIEKTDQEIGHYKVLIRRYSSDYQVFKQVMIEREYQACVDFILKYSQPNEILRIIDGGGNIGLSTLYLKKKFSDAGIVCIEPDEGNLSMIQSQIELNSLKNVKALKAAIWNKNEELTLNHQFRDGQEWSITVSNNINQEETNTYKVDGLTISKIADLQGWDQIDLLKLDIEGAERFIFESIDSVKSFLPKTRYVAMEIHDEFDIRENIKSIFDHYNFSYIFGGELIIARNLNFDVK